ncbi:MAG: cytochrome C oxidase subunit IV family protein [Chloroflexi bacterium]|nr:cytochrome C oxidase subunit IV family protein [Chloroflexota bacterium]
MQTKAPQDKERAYPPPLTYVKVGLLLGFITAVEVGIFYVQALRGAFIPIFLVLSAVKFALVAMFYMRLRFDSRLFSWLFVGGLLLAAAVMVALMALFQVFIRG